MALDFDMTFDPRYGEAVSVAPMVRRLTAENPGPFTFHGTNTYLVGENALAVIDPGPEDERHLQAILTAAGDAPITHIFVSHTHRDHSPLAGRLKAKT
jgi:glyoxylase-like metal-dependent hydrolase (beta-lactamase superfamily II)